MTNDPSFPDINSPEFAAEARRQSRLVGESPHEAEDQAWIAAAAKPDFTPEQQRMLDALAGSPDDQIDLTDPDCRPITDEDIASGRVRFVINVLRLRNCLDLSQEEFAARYRIPVATVRDWEERRKWPDAPARAYLEVIAAAPEWVAGILTAPNPQSYARREPHPSAPKG